MGDKLKWESRERLGLVLMGLAIGFTAGGVFANLVIAYDFRDALLFWVILLIPMLLLGVAFVLFAGYEKNKVIWERAERKQTWESIEKVVKDAIQTIE